VSKKQYFISLFLFFCFLLGVEIEFIALLLFPFIAISISKTFRDSIVLFFKDSFGAPLPQLQKQNGYAWTLFCIVPFCIGSSLLLDTFQHYIGFTRDNPFEKMDRITFFLLLVPIAPLIEEIFFRKFLLDLFRKYANELIAVIATAILFGLCHTFNYLGPVIIGYFAAVYAIRTGNLWCSYLLHLCNNTIAFIMIMLSHTATGQRFLGGPNDDSMNVPVGIFFLAVGTLAYFLTRRKSNYSRLIIPSNLTKYPNSLHSPFSRNTYLLIARLSVVLAAMVYFESKYPVEQTLKKSVGIKFGLFNKIEEAKLLLESKLNSDANDVKKENTFFEKFKEQEVSFTGIDKFDDDGSPRINIHRFVCFNNVGIKNPKCRYSTLNLTVFRDRDKTSMCMLNLPTPQDVGFSKISDSTWSAIETNNTPILVDFDKKTLTVSSTYIKSKKIPLVYSKIAVVAYGGSKSESEKVYKTADEEFKDFREGGVPVNLLQKCKTIRFDTF